MRSPCADRARLVPWAALLLAITWGGFVPAPVHANFEDDAFAFMNAVLQMMPQFAEAPREFRQLNHLLENMLAMLGGHHGHGMHRHGPPPWAHGHMGRGMAIAHLGGRMDGGDFGRRGGDGAFPKGDGMLAGVRDGKKGGRIGAGMQACGRDAQGPGDGKKAGPANRPGEGPATPKAGAVAHQPKVGGMIGGKAGQGPGHKNLDNGARPPQGQVKNAPARPAGNAKPAPIHVAPAQPKDLAQARQGPMLQGGVRAIAKNQPPQPRSVPGKNVQPGGAMALAKNKPAALATIGPQAQRGMMKPTVGPSKNQSAFGGVAKPLVMPRPNQAQAMAGMARPMGPSKFQGPQGIAKPMNKPQPPAVNFAGVQPKLAPQANRPQTSLAPKGGQPLHGFAKTQPRPMPNPGNINAALRFSPVAGQRGPTPLIAARGVGGKMGSPRPR